MAEKLPWRVETRDGRLYARFLLDIDAYHFVSTAPGMIHIGQVVKEEE